MNVVFIIGMPFDIENRNKEFKKVFNGFKIKYYLTNYISKWSDNNSKTVINNSNYILKKEYNNIDAKYYSKDHLFILYKKYYNEIFNFLIEIFNDVGVKDYFSSKYFSIIQETLNEHVYYQEIIKNEDLSDYDKIIIASTNMHFYENELDFISCFSDKYHHFINDTNEFFMTRTLNKKDLTHFDYDFRILAWNFWWTKVEKFKQISQKFPDDLMYIYRKMYKDGKIAVTDTEIARGYILNKYLDNGGPLNVKKFKPNFEKIRNGFFTELEKVDAI